MLAVCKGGGPKADSVTAMARVLLLNACGDKWDLRLIGEQVHHLENKHSTAQRLALPSDLDATTVSVVLFLRQPNSRNYQPAELRNHFFDERLPGTLWSCFVSLRYVSVSLSFRFVVCSRRCAEQEAALRGGAV